MNRQNFESLIETITHMSKEAPGLVRAWRKRRIARWRRLSRWQKAADIALNCIWAVMLYILFVDVNFLWLFGKSPTLQGIFHPPQSVASEIISADGQLIGKYFDENRKLVEYKDISPELINTLISTEDVRFYKHMGIDIEGLFAAMIDTIKGNARGASTITQQLVKNMYKTRSQYSTGLLGYVPVLRIVVQKTKEWTAAIKIEIFYSKEEILTMYLNTVSFGNNAYGIHTAARTYFESTPDLLNYEQSAVLVGLLKATTAYNPLINPERSKERRNVVLQQLAVNKFITQEASDSLRQLPLIVNYTAEKKREGIAPYFRDHLERFLEKWGEENGYDIYADGLKIYVTLDSRMQNYAEEAVQKQMKHLQARFSEYSTIETFSPESLEKYVKKTNLYKDLYNKFGNDPDILRKHLTEPRVMKVFDYSEKGYKETKMSTLEYIQYMDSFLHCGFVVMEPDTKKVKAWVGDINYDNWQYDKVAQSKRQPGSTFKLFVYAAAINAGKSPCDKFVDKPVTIKYDGGVWRPRNANGTYAGYPMTLRSAFAQSINSIAAQVAQEVGISNVAKCARSMGIQSRLIELPSLSLGSSGVSLLEMVNGYSTVISEGMYGSPVIVSRIVDNAGNTIYEGQAQQERVISYENSFLITELLKGGLTEPGGTSRALWSWDLFRWDTDFGGKTGTSSNYSDAWYIGVTPKLVGGAWVGADKHSARFRSSRLGQGSRAALPIFGMFMEKLLADEGFARYRVRFPKEPREPINRQFKCPVYVPPNVDETETSEEDVSETLPVAGNGDSNLK